jgi:hypothetical protein
MTTAVAVVMHPIKYQHNALEQTHYREALAISAIVADVPTLLSVRDDGANEWAVFSCHARGCFRPPPNRAPAQ